MEPPDHVLNRSLRHALLVKIGSGKVDKEKQSMFGEEGASGQGPGFADERTGASIECVDLDLSLPFIPR